MRGQREIGAYKMVTIGTDDKAQTWMAQNLDYEVDGSQCYDGDCSYGRYYSWKAAINNSTPDVNGNIQGVCPDGWHLPTKAEWEQLISNAHENGRLEAGKVLKDSVGWRNSDFKGNNARGFTAVPAGYMVSNAGRSFYRENAFFWSATEFVDEKLCTNCAYFMVLAYNSNGAAVSNNYSQVFEMSIRCLKD